MGSDPYANVYSVARNSYYSNTAYPTTQFDGSWTEGPFPASNSAYASITDQRMAISTSFDIEILGSYSGNDYDIIVRVTKEADYSGTNLKVRLALTESDVGGYQFVNRLMVPDANGTDITFTSVGQTIDIPLSFVFDDAWDIDNCELVAFIQDDGTKESLNTDTELLTGLQPAVPIAAFEGSPLSGYPPLSVDFTDLSAGLIDTWDWTFGDGNTSTSENPTNVYDTPGTYSVSLTVAGTGGTDTETITDYVEVIPLPPAPVADFEADVTEGQAPLTVHFTDLSSSVIDSWDWQFGNGGFSGLENPTCTYSSAGSYTVTLTVAGPGGSDVETKTEYIVVTEAAPEPDFTSDYTYGPAPLTVNFIDMSEGTVDTWLWAFGDGSTSTDQNPEHIFTDEDYFDVSLTVTGPGGTQTITKDDFINTLNLVSLTVSASPEEICVMQTSQLNAEATGGSETYTYSWTSNPEGFVSDEQSPMVSPTETTTYMIEVSDGEQVVSNEIEVMVNPLPEITLGEWPEQLCNQQEPAVQLSAMPEGGVYSGEHVTAEGVFSPEEAMIGWNVITYTYVDENGCENMGTDSIYVDNCVGIYDPFDNETSFVIYPNPNTGQFTIKSDQTIQRVEVIDQLGKSVFNKEFGLTDIRINTNLNKGVYFVKILLVDKNGEDKTLHKKILIN